MNIPYEEHARDMRDEWRQAELDAERESSRLDEFWHRYGCPACDTSGKELCSCCYEAETEETHCETCGFTGYVECKACEGKGHVSPRR